MSDLPCDDGSANTGPTLKGFYGRITTFRTLRSQNDKIHFVSSIKMPDSQMSKDYPDGGMINVNVTDGVEALYHYIATSNNVNSTEDNCAAPFW